jgi:hypothetical protein
MSLSSREEALAGPRGPARWIAAAWAAVLSVVAWHHIPLASASHTHTGSSQFHIATIHSNDGTSTTPGGQDEQYCIQSQTPAINGTQMADFIQSTLSNQPGKMWDGAANWRVDLWRTQKACNEYDSATRSTIEIEYQLKDDWWEVSMCGGSYSCVVADKPVWDSVGGHTHYQWMYAYLQTEHVSGYDTPARRTINRMTGHMWGLQSGTDCAVESVMHSGCPSTLWYPTAADLAAVTRVADRTNTY